jgi:predicted NBD/HSP70 family sugar kinase
MRNGTGEVLSQLRDAGPMSRADLARATGLSSAAVTKLISRMHEGNLIQEISEPQEKSLGRPPITLKLRKEACAVIAVHMTAGKVDLALSNLDLELDERRSFEFDVATPVDDVIKRTVRLAREALLASSIPTIRVVGAGIVVPGGVDPTNRSSTSSVISGWSDVAFADAFEEALGVPTTVENNATAMAMAEACYGECRSAESILYILVGKGTGGGFAQSAPAPRRGPVEIGHIAVQPNGPSCICGGEGCLEVFFSEDPLKALAPDGVADAEHIIASAMKSPQWPQTYDYVLQAFSTSVTLLAPQRIVLGGLMNDAPAAFVDALRRDLPPRVMPHLRRNLRIERTSLTGPIGVNGAACVALEKFFYEQGPTTGLAKKQRKKPSA